ncbi:2-C-methyl-D-erythritol 4-phosphate cytidylyltransferase [Haloplasma contractile]|uniref:2-C-methyl-D-erythritol 4-phosphate cytidylyltransferase n=1 Tax=Haloplasma contractile SSD-17B TaxID=1033810 RepID=U2ECB2_9MOLU|nr:2-C-methyl-D-erythritol 4-phosphate cytidylyltransferase [Haloplasma contractile]ERJ12416.1 2-C-methyl-D-erythritol 4-phosphate cytidylyltransferase protein [Haloplasma contractile SSD-17B]
MNYAIILLAAGTGSRMNLGYNKMLMKIKNTPLISLTASTFFKDPKCKQIIYVTNSLEMNDIEAILKEQHLWDERCIMVSGGKERQYSVYNGLSVVNEAISLVHDGARPFVTNKMISELIKQASTHGCAIPAVKVKDTIKLVHNKFVTETLPRKYLYAVQTPQACVTKALLSAHALAKEDDYLGTDEASLIERYSEYSVFTVDGSYDNIKLTTKEDIKVAEEIIKHRSTIKY